MNSEMKPALKLTPSQRAALEVAIVEGGLRYGGMYMTTIRKDVPKRLSQMGLMRLLDKPTLPAVRSEWVATDAGRDVFAQLHSGGRS